MRICFGVIFAAVLAAGGAGIAQAFSSANGVACASQRTRTFVVRPSDASPGATTSLLLWCRWPTPLGFEGSFGPTGLVLYSDAALKELHDVHGFLRPMGGSPKPIRPRYDIVGPDEIAVMIPPALAAGVYVVVIDDGTADVPSQNRLDVP
jgi:hypothetical protein